MRSDRLSTDASAADLRFALETLPDWTGPSLGGGQRLAREGTLIALPVLRLQNLTDSLSDVTISDPGQGDALARPSEESSLHYSVSEWWRVV